MRESNYLELAEEPSLVSRVFCALRLGFLLTTNRADNNGLPDLTFARHYQGMSYKIELSRQFHNKFQCLSLSFSPKLFWLIRTVHSRNLKQGLESSFEKGSTQSYFIFISLSVSQSLLYSKYIFPCHALQGHFMFLFFFFVFKCFLRICVEFVKNAKICQLIRRELLQHFTLSFT